MLDVASRARGLMETKTIRRVRTEAGVRRYKQPIGSIIMNDSLLIGVREIASGAKAGDEWVRLEGENGKTYTVTYHSPTKYGSTGRWSSVEDGTGEKLYDGKDQVEAYVQTAQRVQQEAGIDTRQPGGPMIGNRKREGWSANQRDAAGSEIASWGNTATDTGNDKLAAALWDIAGDVEANDGDLRVARHQLEQLKKRDDLRLDDHLNGDSSDDTYREVVDFAINSVVKEGKLKKAYDEEGEAAYAADTLKETAANANKPKPIKTSEITEGQWIRSVSKEGEPLGDWFQVYATGEQSQIVGRSRILRGRQRDGKKVTFYRQGPRNYWDTVADPTKVQAKEPKPEKLDSSKLGSTSNGITPEESEYEGFNKYRLANGQAVYAADEGKKTIVYDAEDNVLGEASTGGELQELLVRLGSAAPESTGVLRSVPSEYEGYERFDFPDGKPAYIEYDGKLWNAWDANDVRIRSARSREDLFNKLNDDWTRVNPQLATDAEVRERILNGTAATTWREAVERSGKTPTSSLTQLAAEVSETSKRKLKRKNEDTIPTGLTRMKDKFTGWKRYKMADGKVIDVGQATEDDNRWYATGKDGWDDIVADGDDEAEVMAKLGVMTGVKQPTSFAPANTDAGPLRGVPGIDRQFTPEESAKRAEQLRRQWQNSQSPTQRALAGKPMTPGEIQRLREQNAPTVRRTRESRDFWKGGDAGSVPFKDAETERREEREERERDEMMMRQAQEAADRERIRASAARGNTIDIKPGTAGDAGQPSSGKDSAIFDELESSIADARAREQIAGVKRTLVTGDRNRLEAARALEIFGDSQDLVGRAAFRRAADSLRERHAERQQESRTPGPVLGAYSSEMAASIIGNEADYHDGKWSAGAVVRARDVRDRLRDGTIDTPEAARRLRVGAASMEQVSVDNRKDAEALRDLADRIMSEDKRTQAQIREDSKAKREAARAVPLAENPLSALSANNLDAVQRNGKPLTAADKRALNVDATNTQATAGRLVPANNRNLANRISRLVPNSDVESYRALEDRATLNYLNGMTQAAAWKEAVETAEKIPAAEHYVQQEATRDGYGQYVVYRSNGNRREEVMTYRAGARRSSYEAQKMANARMGQENSNARKAATRSLPASGEPGSTPTPENAPAVTTAPGNSTEARRAEAATNALQVYRDMSNGGSDWIYVSEVRQRMREQGYSQEEQDEAFRTLSRGRQVTFSPYPVSREMSSDRRMGGIQIGGETSHIMAGPPEKPGPIPGSPAAMHNPTGYVSTTPHEKREDYRRDYERGWRDSARPNRNLENADKREEPDAYYDGWSDYSTDAGKWATARNKDREIGIGTVKDPAELDQMPEEDRISNLTPFLKNGPDYSRGAVEDLQRYRNAKNKGEHDTALNWLLSAEENAGLRPRGSYNARMDAINAPQIETARRENREMSIANQAASIDEAGARRLAREDPARFMRVVGYRYFKQGKDFRKKENERYRDAYEEMNSYADELENAASLGVLTGQLDSVLMSMRVRHAGMMGIGRTMMTIREVLRKEGGR